MRAGFIGYRHFAQKLKIFFENTGRVKNFLFYHPDKRLKNLSYTNKLEDLYGCDFIVIASPDQTHGYYLRKLKDYKKYIFCEKIPVVSRKDLVFLETHPNPRLYFNFNFRKSYLRDILFRESGRILHINFAAGHGLALKKSYRNNWRSDPSAAALGVFQVSGIHLFDLLIFCFGCPVSYHFTCRNISGYGDSVDNFNIAMYFKNKISANLFLSYTSPYLFDLKIITRDALIIFQEDKLTIRGPRQSYDKNGCFIMPPVKSVTDIALYEDSLKRSVDYFLRVVGAKKTFAEAKMESNLLSTRIFLDILTRAKSRGYI